jgi:POT family proton-dependent oligopeptide transporter
MWERFSYYGMRTILILFMVDQVQNGGLGWNDKDAGAVYGLYTAMAYLMCLGGGWVADRITGQRWAVMFGGILITLGEFCLFLQADFTLYLGLVLLMIGTGFLKGNVSTIVGQLYAKGDIRRDAGFSIFYMGINLGAFIGPLIAGYLAQNVDWHIGFAAAGVGMALGLIQYVLGKRHLQPALTRIDAQPSSRQGTATLAGPMSADDWKRIAAITVLFVFASIFWAAYEQAGSTLNLFADRYTRLSVLGFSFPSSWFQSVQPFFVIVLAPVFAWFWIRLGSRQPSSPAKFAYGLLFAGLTFVVLVPAAALAQSGEGVRVSPMWLVFALFLSELGELCLSPVGLSVVTKLAPSRILGLMMGVWFLSNSVGNKLAGYAAGFFSTLPLTVLFGTVAAISLAAALVLFVLVKPIKRLMGGVL